jgi:hypothetical protein
MRALSRIRQLKKLKAEYKRPDTARLGELKAKSLGPFIPALSGSQGYREPRHLRVLLAQLETLHNTQRKLCVSVPPRHGKTETLLHWFAWLLLRYPGIRILYVTHTASFALKQSKAARKLAKTAGVQLSDESNRADEWETESGGGLVARSIDGDITGRGFDIVVVDDPFKNRQAAESALQREAIYQAFKQDIYTRLTPQGSVVVVHTRWHVTDLIGRLVKELAFEHLNIRAIAVNDNARPDNDNWRDDRHEGEALWPEGGWTTDVLGERRRIVGEYGWWSLYQGEPRPRGGAVFEAPTYYDELPSKAYRVGYGCDLAYSKKTSRDYSVCIEIWREDREGLDANNERLKPLYYVVDVQRKQVKAPEFTLTLRAKVSHRPGPMRWYAYGPELGVADFIKQLVPQLDVVSKSDDKFGRAQPVAATWNDSRFLVPSPKNLGLDDGEDMPDVWLQFLGELADFTGVNDVTDDQVDALAAGHDVLDLVSEFHEPDPNTGGSRWDGYGGGRGFG